MPDSTEPSETIESIALPMRPTESRTNFAGGELTACEWIGQSMLYRLKIGSVEMRSRCASKNESIVPTSRQ